MSWPVETPSCFTNARRMFSEFSVFSWKTQYARDLVEKTGDSCRNERRGDATRVKRSFLKIPLGFLGWAPSLAFCFVCHAACIWNGFRPLFSPRLPYNRPCLLRRCWSVPVELHAPLSLLLQLSFILVLPSWRKRCVRHWCMCCWCSQSGGIHDLILLYLPRSFVVFWSALWVPLLNTHSFPLDEGACSFSSNKENGLFWH